MANTKTPTAKKTPTTKKTPEPTKPVSTRTPTNERIRVGGVGLADKTSLEPIPFSPDQRHNLIRDAAYFRAERRDFTLGDPVQDWVEAEAEVDRMLQEAPGSATGR